VSGGCKCRSTAAGRANGALTNPLAGFDGHFEAGQERKNGKEGREREETEGMGEPPPQKKEFLVTALSVYSNATVALSTVAYIAIQVA